MPSPPPGLNRPDLGALVDVAVALRADEDTPRVERRHRDRAIGRDLAACGGDPARQLAAWATHPDAPDPGGAGRTARRVYRLASLILCLAGLAGGWAAAAAVFRFDGDTPINVIHVLAVFVFAQVLLVGLTVITMLPRSWLGYLPGARTVQDTLALFSPGRIRGGLWRRLPASVREAIDGALGQGLAHHALFGSVDKWAVSQSAQWGAVCFHLGALAGCLWQVVFSDLVFGWNTTLRVEPAGLHRLTSALAAPWAGWLPGANPSLALIEASRHFRLHGGMFPGLDAGPAGGGPAVLGGWWPFLVAAMVAYGLLPRLVTLAVATARLRAAVRKTLLHLPGAPDLLDRLNGQLVETAAGEPASPSAPTPAAPPLDLATANWPASPGMHVINWARVEVPNTALGQWFPVPVRSAHEAGGARSLAEDRAVIEALAGQPDREPVAILVRAWEPPVTEFVDFVAGLRAALGAERGLAVVPIGMAEDHRPLAHESRMWQRRLAALGDPRLRVIVPEAGG